MTVIDDHALRDTAARALQGNTPPRLFSFSLEFESRTGNLMCLAIFSGLPTEAEIDNVSSAIAEIEAAWPQVRSTTDRYLSTLQAAGLNSLRVGVINNFQVVAT